MEIQHSVAPLTGLLLRGVVKVPRKEESRSTESTAQFVFAKLRATPVISRRSQNVGT